MNKKKIVQNTFAFLNNKGFEFEYSNSYNTAFCYWFSKDNTLINIDEDYTHEFVALKIKKGNKILLEVFEQSSMLNENFIGYSEMMESIRKIYSKAFEKRRSISDMYFKLIIEEYSKFIERNLSKVL